MQKVIGFMQILLGIHALLTEPNPLSPAQSEAYQMFVYGFSWKSCRIYYFRKDKDAYDKKILEQAQTYHPAD